MSVRVSGSFVSSFEHRGIVRLNFGGFAANPPLRSTYRSTALALYGFTEIRVPTRLLHLSSDLALHTHLDLHIINYEQASLSRHESPSRELARVGLASNGEI